MKDEIFTIISESESEYKESVLNLLKEYTHLFSAFVELRELHSKYSNLVEQRTEICNLLINNENMDPQAVEEQYNEIDERICTYEPTALMYKEIAPYFTEIDNVFNYLARTDHARLLLVFEGKMNYKLAADILLEKVNGDFENVFLKPLLMLHSRCIRIPLL